MRDPIDMLLDENNSEPIVLYNEKDEPVAFEQIALIVLQGDPYAILKPVDEYQGVAEDEALVFLLDEDENGDRMLVVVEDDGVVDAVFEEYYALLRKEGLL